MKLLYEDATTSLLMTWFGEAENRKWFQKIRRNLKRFKISPTDDIESEFIDTDILLDLYLDEYTTKKKANLKELQTAFINYYNLKKDSSNQYSTVEIEDIVQPVIPVASNSAFVKFPGLVTIRRAFLYSLTCKDNNDCVNLVEFLAGCNRFALDNPAPSIHKRINLYGNEDDYEGFMRKQLEKYNIAV